MTKERRSILSKTLAQPDIQLPVYSAHGRNRSFLEIVQRADRIRVQPTELGRSSLNRFWPVWLRDVILEKTDRRHGFAVEIYRKGIVVSSGTSPEGLQETVRSLAAQIRPLMHLPIKRWNDRNNEEAASYGPIEWAVTRKGLPVATLINTLKLPRGGVVKFDEWDPWHSNYGLGRITLTARSGAVSLREMAMSVELHFALAVAT